MRETDGIQEVRQITAYQLQPDDVFTYRDITYRVVDVSAEQERDGMFMRVIVANPEIETYDRRRYLDLLPSTRVLLR